VGGALKFVLPCADACRPHYQAITDERFAAAIASKTELQRFVAELHNDVNARTGKKVLSDKEVDEYRATLFKEECEACRAHLAVPPRVVPDKAAAPRDALAPDWTPWAVGSGLLLLLIIVAMVLLTR